MNRGKNSTEVLFAGRFNRTETLSGPEKTAKRIFAEFTKANREEGKYNKPGLFIEYFFDGRKYGIFRKLFGKEEFYIDKFSAVKRLGLFRLPAVINRYKPDILHIITFERFAVILLLLAKLKKIKVIYNSHGAVTYENSSLKKTGAFHKFKDKTVEMLFLKFSDKIVFPSDAVIELGQRDFNFNESKAVILPGGIDRVFYNNKINPVTGKPLKAVFIYKNNYSSSGLRFLNSFLDKFRDKLELYIISPVKIELSAKEPVKVFIINPMVSTELAEFYSGKDIFLSLNSYDTFSISSAEAMASGLIPVLTKETGLERYIENTVNGFIVDYGDTNALLKTIHTVNSYSAEELYDLKLNAAGIYDTLKWENVNELYNNLYEELNS